MPPRPFLYTIQHIETSLHFWLSQNIISRKFHYLQNRKPIIYNKVIFFNQICTYIMLKLRIRKRICLFRYMSFDFHSTETMSRKFPFALDFYQEIVVDFVGFNPICFYLEFKFYLLFIANKATKWIYKIFLTLLEIEICCYIK